MKGELKALCSPLFNTKHYFDSLNESYIAKKIASFSLRLVTFNS